MPALLATTYPDYFVDAWESFQSQAVPPEASDASFDAVLAAVEAAQVQLVNGRPGPLKALWSNSDDVTLSGAWAVRSPRAGRK